MKVSTVINAIPLYNYHHWLDDLRTLAEQSCQSQTLPFAVQTPPPANINIMRNQGGGAINTQKLELQAACLGIDRLAWIFGADAEYIGLTLKNSEPEPAYPASGQGSFNPVLLLAKIKGRKPEPLDAQYAYFIDQFTETSVTRCAASFNQELSNSKESGDETVRERRSRMARNILYALEDYDSGLSRRDIKEQALKNIRKNSAKGTPGFIKARSSYQALTGNLNPAGKTVFNRIRTYTEKQETGADSFTGSNPGPLKTAYAAFQSFLENPSAFSKVWFDAGSFTRGLMASQFKRKPASTVKAGMYNRKEADHDR
ncbi:MAG: hypothetical protein LBL44_05450 [Treponema sp.]|jgi:hypothetical protein|nr:hypothetical protein [Treponema sp.]